MLFNLLWWQIILILLTFTGCILTTIIVLKKTNTTLRAKDSKGNEIQLGEKAAKKELVSLPPSTNPRSDSEPLEDKKLFSNISARNMIALIVKKSVIFGNRQTQVSMISTMQDQMNSAQMRTGLFKSHLMKIFQSLLIEKKGTDLNLSYDTAYVIFSTVVRDYIEDLMLNLKQRFKENHFTDRLEEEFEKYVEGYVTSYMDEWYSTLSLNYLHRLVPTREDIIESINPSDEARLREYLKECFYQARLISFRNEKLLEALEQDFDKEINDIIQMNPSIEC